MNKKSFGISFFVGTSVLFLLFSLYLIVDGAINVSSVGLFLSSLGSAGFFILLYTFLKRPRTNKYLSVYSAFVFAGFVLAVLHSLKSRDIYFTSFMTLALTLGWVWYLFVYSRFAKRDSEILFSDDEMLPTISLKRLNGTECTLNDFSDKRLILMFYRGNWCPLCMSQIEEIVHQFKELEKRKAKILFISPQPEKHTRKLAAKYGLESNFYIDEDNLAAKQLGVIDEKGLPLGLQVLGFDSDTVKPTVILLDERRQVIYSDTTDNYRIRPEPSHFLKVLDAYEKKKRD